MDFWEIYTDAFDGFPIKVCDWECPNYDGGVSLGGGREADCQGESNLRFWNFKWNILKMNTTWKIHHFSTKKSERC